MKKYKNILIISAAIFALCLILYILSGSETVPIDNKNLEIADESVKSVNIDIITEEIKIENYSLPIPSYTYTENELEAMTADCEKALVSEILGSNESFEMITRDLLFPESVDGYPFKLSYETTDEMLINCEGTILCEEPFDSEIIIIMSYGSFYTDFSIPVHVEPDSKTWEKIKKERLINELIAGINNENAMMKTDKSYVINLPGDVDGESVDYYYSGRKRNVFYLIIAPVVVGCLIWGFWKDEKDKKKKLDESVLDEYPGMIQKMSLYLISGMTIRNIWILLYEEAEKKNNCENQLYKEMRVSANELRSGILEQNVYRKFGERLQIPEIVRFSALLSQNIRKGSTRLSEQLTEEARAAFEKKKQRVMKRGAEAGTHLLFPMMLLLIDVMVMIIIPAFWNI